MYCSDCGVANEAVSVSRDQEALTWKYSDTWSCYFGIQSWTLVGEMGRSFSEGGR